MPVPSVPLSERIAQLTIDGGYRRIAATIEEWGSLCIPLGGSIPLDVVAGIATSLATFSRDPALANLAPVVANLMGNCCPAQVSPVAGDLTTQVRALTLDPGAVRLASVLDSMRVSCCVH